jgi:hypothetical protein
MKGICNAAPAELSFEWQADETSAFICCPTCPSEHVEQQREFKYAPFVPLLVQVNGNQSAVVLPPIVLLYMAEEGASKDLKEIGWLGLNTALLFTGVGEIAQAIRAGKAAAALGERFVLKTIGNALLGTADVGATGISSFCGLDKNKGSGFCKEWAKYELAINLGLLSATSLDLLYTSMGKSYSAERDLFDPAQKKYLEDELGLGQGAVQGAGKFSITKLDDYLKAISTRNPAGAVGSAPRVYQEGVAGALEYEIKGGANAKIWADGLDKTTGTVIEAKYISNTSTSPFVEGSSYR